MASLNISIKNPCSEKWNSFEKNDNIGFCSSCQKNVIDFTKYSDQEIIEFFKKNNGNTCGRLRPDQLKIYPGENKNPFYKIAAILTAGILTISNAPAVAQTLCGRVVDQDKQAMAGTTVIIKGTNQGTEVDRDGNFHLIFNGEKEATLIFQFVGYKSQEKTFTLSQVSNFGETILEVDDTWMGEIIITEYFPTPLHRLWSRTKNLFRRL